MEMFIYLLIIFGIRQVGYLNDGILQHIGTILIFDTDRDSLYELIFCEDPSHGNNLVLYGQVNYDTLLFNGPYIIVPYDPDWSRSPAPWLIGDFDNDGLYDIVNQDGWHDSTGNSAVGISIYEQPDSFSYPTVEIYRDTTYTGAQIVMNSGDLDGDGVKEFYKGDGTTEARFLVWETRGNDAFKRTFDGVISYTGAYGAGVSEPCDFDGDGRNEFVIGGLEWHFWVGEAVKDDTFAFIWRSPILNTTNTFDVKALPDLDKDGKPEFMVKGWTSDGRTTCLIYEAVANDTYDIIWDTVYTGNNNGTGLSAVGDVDMDGEPELVVELGKGFVILKSDRDNHFKKIGRYIGTNPGISHIKIAPDIDRNGINEIVVSGAGSTWFFEYQGTEVEERPFILTKSRYRIFRIYDITGRLIGTSPLESFKDRKMKKGIYFIKTKEKTFKIIKIR